MKKIIVVMLLILGLVVPCEAQFSAHNENYFVVDSDAMDMEFQVSFKQRLMKRLPVYFGFTQTAWWATSKPSAPMDEFEFSPEAFIELGRLPLIPMDLSVGVRHHSNGRDGFDSREWNRAEVNLKGKVWLFDLRLTAWDVFRVSDYNADIQDYVGYGEVEIEQKNKWFEVGTTLRRGSDVGSAETYFKYPFHVFGFTPRIFVKSFSGYGERLSRYDERERNIKFGLEFK